MRKIIKNTAIIEDQWTLLDADVELNVALNTQQAIVPLALWQGHKEQLKAINPIGVWLEAEQEIESLLDDLELFTVIALNFPVFTDGRHFSSARLLRERYAYSGEIRAIGFDAYALRSDRCPIDALKSLTELSVSYQAAYDQSLPLYRRRSA